LQKRAVTLVVLPRRLIYRPIHHQRIIDASLTAAYICLPDFFVLRILFDIGGADSIDLHAATAVTLVASCCFETFEALEQITQGDLR